MRHTAIAAIVVGILGFAGGAYASATGLIGSAQIRDHSIRLIDLSPATVRALRGHVGPQGPPGTFDPTKVVAIVGPQVLIFPGQEKSTSATCPPGAVATGGGGYSPDISPLNLTGPLIPSGSSTTQPTTWFVDAVNRGNLGSALMAVVVCATP